MSERHEIPEKQVPRLVEIRSRAEDAVAETIRAKARLYDCILNEARLKEELQGVMRMTAEFIEIDLNRGYKMTTDCKAFVLEDK